MNLQQRSSGCLLVTRASFTYLAIILMTVAAPPNVGAAGNLFGKKSAGGQSGKKTPSRPLFFSKKTPKNVPTPLVAIPVPSVRSSPPVNARLFAGPLPQVQKTNPDQIRVFVLGDSQSITSFGPELQKKLAEAGYEVLFHGVKNGTPYFWGGNWPSPVLTRTYSRIASPEESGHFEEVAMKPRSIREYVESFDPDVFVFQAGTNFEVDLAVDNPTEISNMLREYTQAAAAKGARVLWIGPPDARDDVKTVAFQDKATATLRGALADVSEKQGYDCFFNSRPVCPITNDTGGDGEHPTEKCGLEWAGAAARWVHDSVSLLNCDGNLRSIGALQLSPLPKSFTQQDSEGAGSLAKAFTVDLQLVAKSNPGDIKTLPYTDAFSVYQYKLQNAAEALPKLADVGLTVPSDITANVPVEPPTIYVLHWAVHNSGSGPRATHIASRKVGETFAMKLVPLAAHPLEKALGTMVQFNDFDDFMAPVFLATNFLEERAY